MMSSRKLRSVVSHPKRFSEIVAFISISTTVVLFIHTQSLTARIQEIQGYLTASASGNFDNHVFKSGASGENHRHSQEETPPKKYITFTLPRKKYDAKELNNTRHARKNILFFNRVPKVGSQTMMNLLKRLSVINDFHFNRDKPQKTEAIKLSYYEESRLTTLIDSLPEPASYTKHTGFSNFTKHGRPMPIYVNMIRDPIERVISWFYYIRAPWYIVERRQAFPELPLPHPAFLRKDFETCVLNGDRECSFIPGEYYDGVGDHRRQAMFFCGHYEKCAEFDGAWAIQEAKRNVEKHYAVVGILEELELSLEVFEKYVPKFFKKAAEVYKENQAEMHKINRNIYKPPVSEEIKELVRKNFTQEIDFYQFCKQRLHMQYVAAAQLEDAGQ